MRAKRGGAQNDIETEPLQPRSQAPPADPAEDEAVPARERIPVLRARLRGLMEEANALRHRKLKPNQRKLR
jgi:hypothetical protein